MKNTIGKPSPEAGFTLVEVMAAMVILIIGVLGTFVVIEGSLASTSRTTAREQGTNVARDLVERSREAAYQDMTMANAPTALRGRLPASDSVSALTGPDMRTFTVTRRNVVYEVTVFACSIDDPTDGAGEGNATFCETPLVTPSPGDDPPGPAAEVNVLGIEVAVGGELLTLVCNALGIEAIGNQLTALLTPVADVRVCPGGSGAGTAPYDSRPDDLRRVRIDVSWKRGGPGSVSQTTLLTNPLQN